MLDNSGAKNLLRIRILGSTRRSVYIGDSIIGVVKNAEKVSRPNEVTSAVDTSALCTGK